MTDTEIVNVPTSRRVARVTCSGDSPEIGPQVIPGFFFPLMTLLPIVLPEQKQEKYVSETQEKC